MLESREAWKSEKRESATELSLSPLQEGGEETPVLQATPVFSVAVKVGLPWLAVVSVVRGI